MSDILAGENLSVMSEARLLRLHASIINELKARGVVRTRNNPIGDYYTEWLVAEALDLELTDNCAAGYDATNSNGKRYQIKGRRITPENNSRQLRCD
uniref:Uncharacterized protein n=1 Tax=Candidatus Kentrum sp. LPFa TaxID=2126335 RepID=A0A450WXQ6_9GAMM|nr:MAG: hypothetical protein BECKLPF1236B_GA0070989_12775 [Candidatus Kentron sp. LPFa]